MFYWLFVRVFFFLFSLFSQWMNRRVYGPPLSAAIANFLFKHYFTPTNYCGVVVREVFGFPLFSSLPASQKKSSLVSMMVVALMKIEHSSMFLTKYIGLLQQQGHLSLFSASLFCSLPSSSTQMAKITSRAAVLVLTEVYFEASEHGEVKRSSGIRIRIAEKSFVYF